MDASSGQPLLTQAPPLRQQQTYSGAPAQAPYPNDMTSFRSNRLQQEERSAGPKRRTGAGASAVPKRYDLLQVKSFAARRPLLQCAHAHTPFVALSPPLNGAKRAHLIAAGLPAFFLGSIATKVVVKTFAALEPVSLFRRHPCRLTSKITIVATLWSWQATPSQPSAALRCYGHSCNR